MDVSIAPKSEAGLVTLSTANNPVEEFCAVGGSLGIELKGKRFHTLMRGAKAEFVTTNILGGKPRLTTVPETSFILADMPRNYASGGFEYNSPLLVRFLVEGSVYAFKTALMGVHSHPPMLVLEYPNEMQRYNMRSSERVSLISPARITIEGAGPEFRMGAVLDISETGARIGLEAKEGVSIGGKIFLSFTLSNGAAVNQLAAIVRSIDEEGGKYFLGIGFLGRDPVVKGYCLECADIAANAYAMGNDTMLELHKEAVIEFARKNGKVLVRGWKEGKNGYLLTEKPQGGLLSIPVGQSATIRVENRGTIYGMAVTYREFLKKTDLCYFPFQDDVVAHSLRNEERVLCQFPASIQQVENEGAKPGAGVIVNLGKGGLRFITRASLQAQPGEVLLIDFHPGGIGSISRLKMRLVRVSGHGGQFEYAAQFMDLDRERAKVLEDYFAFYRVWAA